MFFVFKPKLTGIVDCPGEETVRAGRIYTEASKWASESFKGLGQCSPRNE